MINSSRVFALCLSWTVLACGAGARQGDTVSPPPAAATQSPSTAKMKSGDPATVNADAALLKDFKSRIDKYMALHDRQEKGQAQLKETNQPEKIKAAQDALAVKIQAARKNAVHGEIFTPDIRQLFRRLMYPEMKGPDAAETKQTIKEDSPTPAQTKQLMKVNSRYPEGEALPTVPANILVRLPQLPEGLEYRILNKDLILRDVNANLIVDFIPNAVQ